MYLELREARLCLEDGCETIHTSMYCPRCGSNQFFYLTRWINREDPVDLLDVVPFIGISTEKYCHVN